MKIFFVGYHNPKFMSFCEYIERAIKELGHELDGYDYRDWLIPGRIRERVNFLQQWDINRINQNLIKKARAFEPDIVLMTGAWTISPETITQLKEELGCVTVNWIADYPLMFDQYVKTGPFFDYFFASGTDALTKYQEAGYQNGGFLPFACDPEIHSPIQVSAEEKKEIDCDVCFIGSCYSERIEILEHLTEFNLGIWGPGWDTLPSSSPLKKFVRGTFVQPNQWAKLLAASKIGLNIIGHRCDVMEPYVPESEFRMTNTKLYEILGCGVFQLVDGKHDAKTLFNDKEHVCFYNNGAECAELIRKYLNEPDERAKIAQQGRDEVLKAHTYKHRVNKILSVVQDKVAT